MSMALFWAACGSEAVAPPASLDPPGTPTVFYYGGDLYYGIQWVPTEEAQTEVWRNLNNGGYALYSTEANGATQLPIGTPPYGQPEFWKLRHLLDGVYSEFSGELGIIWGIP